MTADPYFNRPSRSPISLHKRQVDPRNTFAEAVDFSYDDVPSHASDRWIGVRVGGDFEDAAAAGRYAAALRDQASQAVVASTLDAFTEYPSYSHRNDGNADLPVNADDVLVAKRDAVDAFTDAWNDVDDNPLGNHLLDDIASSVERGDRQLDRLVNNVRSYDDDEWLEHLYRLLLGYRGAALEADAVPGVIELVRAESRDT